MPKAKILRPDNSGIASAVAALRQGQVVGMPTETVYGLAGSALNPDALARIFEAKERPTFDPLIVHVASSEEGTPLDLATLDEMGLVNAQALSKPARNLADALIKAFWPGPLTLVLPKKDSVPDLCTSGLPSVAIRMPRHPVAQRLIRESGMPLAAPSANRFGRISPTAASAVLEELGDRIDWIVDGGPCEVGVESTVIEIPAQGAPRLLRPGGLPRAEIEKVAGLTLETSVTPDRVTAPGMLESHYAPSKPLFLLRTPARFLQAHELREALAPSGAEARSIGSAGVLVISGAVVDAESRLSVILGCPVTGISLSTTGDLREIARNLFAGLREMDSKGIDVIFAETCPVDQGLGHAIDDRLRRASAKRPG